MLFCAVGPQSSFCYLLFLFSLPRLLIAMRNQHPSCSQGCYHSHHGSSPISLLPRYPSHCSFSLLPLPLPGCLALGCVWWCQCWIGLNTSTTFFTTESAFLPHSLPGCCPAGYFGSYASWPGALPCPAKHSQPNAAQDCLPVPEPEVKCYFIWDTDIVRTSPRSRARFVSDQYWKGLAGARGDVDGSPLQCLSCKQQCCKPTSWGLEEQGCEKD